MAELNTKNIDSDMASHIERIYDDVVIYCLNRKVFDSELLCKVFELDEYTCSELITTMVINGVVGDVSDDGIYKVSDEYVHSDFLAMSNVGKHTGEKIKYNKKESGSAGKYFALLALVVFLISIYFLFRSPMSLLLLIPLSLIVAALSDKIGAIASSIGVIVVCVFSLIFVNSSTPIFGEKYEARIKAEDYRDSLRKEVIEEMNQISFGEKRLKSSLKDPSSANIRNSKLGRSGVVCGQVNAKNSFGAYTGYKNFIQIGSTSLIDDGTKDFANEWDDLCN
ncbi:hypothetical protein [Providencia manganoxydans]|uniref:hypothetical protein n=1 Tax=Providencia manganoxydans TaxID=2923283 RepID=UPI0034E4A2FF